MKLFKPILVLTVCIMFNELSAQKINRYSEEYVDPKPVLGWDSLVRNFHISDIGFRMRIGFVIVATLSLDSTGQITDLEVDNPYPLIKKSSSVRINGFHKYLDSLLTSSVRNRIQSSQWIPAHFKERRIESTICIPILFEILGPDTSPVLRVMNARQYSQMIE
jgi:hypothetical protein